MSMSICKYVYCEDADKRDDYESHIFQNVFDQIAKKLPTDPMANGREQIVWYDEEGDEIICKTSEIAELIANILDSVSGEHESHTGYYDPQEDALEPNGPFRTTGWYYVDFD